MDNAFVCLLFIGLIASCSNRERNCTDFHEGSFSVVSGTGERSTTSTFRREGGFEYDYYEGHIDTSRVRWINDCECILQKVNPQTPQEKKPIHIRILFTTDSSYTFEFGYLDEPTTFKGTAYSNQNP